MVSDSCLVRHGSSNSLVAAKDKSLSHFHDVILFIAPLYFENPPLT